MKRWEYEGQRRYSTDISPDSTVWTWSAYRKSPQATTGQIEECDQYHQKCVRKIKQDAYTRLAQASRTSADNSAVAHTILTSTWVEGIVCSLVLYDDSSQVDSLKYCVASIKLSLSRQLKKIASTEGRSKIRMHTLSTAPVDEKNLFSQACYIEWQRQVPPLTQTTKTISLHSCREGTTRRLSRTSSIV